MARRPRLPRRRRPLVVATIAGGLLLTGCGSAGGSGSPAATGTSSAPESSAAPAPTSEAPSTTPDPQAAAFCADAQRVFGQLNNAFDAAQSQGPTALPPLLDRTVTAFDQVQPPPAIAADWDSVQAGFATLRQRVESLDLAAPDAGAKVQAAVQDVQAQVGAPFERVSGYTDANCPEPSASPTT